MFNVEKTNVENDFNRCIDCFYHWKPAKKNRVDFDLLWIISNTFPVIHVELHVCSKDHYLNINAFNNNLTTFRCNISSLLLK